MVNHGKRRWEIEYSVTYMGGRVVTGQKATVGPCTFLAMPQEAALALCFLYSLPEVEGVCIEGARPVAEAGKHRKAAAG
jgi:hypothetical protein